MSEAASNLSLEAVDRAAAAVADLARVLADLGKAARPNFRAKQSRFSLLCLDLFHGAKAVPSVEAAFRLVQAVESGSIGRGQVEDRAHALLHLDPVDRAFAAGLALGFMTEFLPREG